MDKAITGSMNIHRCARIVFERYVPDNANAVSFRFASHDGYSDFHVTVFNLPTEIAERFAEALKALDVKEPEAVE